MNAVIFECKKCGAPNKIIESQLVSRCNRCDKKYYIHREIPPAVVLKGEINKDKAMELISNELKNKEVSKGFFENAVPERAALYYIPFFEVRGMDQDRLSQSYWYLEKANDLNELDMDLFDHLDVKSTILKSQYTSFNPVEMRRGGMIIPPEKIQLLKTKLPPVSHNVVENYHRVIYFPVWEIIYVYEGISYKNYLSAIDGEVIKLRALRDNGKKRLLSLLGLLALAILLGRGSKEGLILGIVLVSIGIPLLALLLPYFWELFAGSEIIEMKGGIAKYFPIYRTEKSFAKMGNMLFKRLIGSKSKDD